METLKSLTTKKECLEYLTFLQPINMLTVELPQPATVEIALSYSQEKEKGWVKKQDYRWNGDKKVWSKVTDRVQGHLVDLVSAIVF